MPRQRQPRKNANDDSFVFPPPERRPVLIKCGRNFINPDDVAAIREVKNGTLYVIDLKSKPDPEYPIWVEPADITELITYFNIKGLDS